MQTLASIAFMLSVFALIIGTCQPRAIIRWGREEEKTIGKVAVFCWIAIFITTSIDGALSGNLKMMLITAVMLIMFWALVLFIVGLFSPKAIIWWGENVNKTRKKAMFFTLITFVFFTGIFGTLNDSSELSNFDVSQKQILAKNQENTQKLKAEQESQAKITAEKKAQEDAAKKESDAKETTSNSKPTVNSDQLKDMQKAFNDLESGNNYKILYSGVGCGIKSGGGESVVVKVNENWNDLSKDMKIAYIKHVVSVWAGMHGARGLAFDPDKFDVTLKHDESGRTVATWGSFWGPSIKD